MTTTTKHPRRRHLLRHPPLRPDPSRSFFTQLEERFDLHRNKTALSNLEDGGWRRISYDELRRRITAQALELRERGHGAGDHVAILAEPSPEWGVAFLAILRAGGIAVPLDVKLEERELVEVLEDARPGVLLVSPRYLERATRLKQRVPTIWEVATLGADRKQTPGPPPPPHRTAPLLDRRPEEVALITYTSGTTGRPKGVMTTFGNLVHQATTLSRIHTTPQHDRLLSVLPLNHLFELVGGFLSILWSGGEVCYGDSHFPDDMLRAIHDRRVTRMLCVPLVLELIERRVRKTIAGRNLLARTCFALAHGTLARIPSDRLRRLLFRRLHEALGGSFRYFVCGGAPLAPATERFFERLGIPVLQGYGLTETSPVVAVNTCQHRRAGSVGRPLPGVEVRIEPLAAEHTAGEILTRGPHLMEGYRGLPELTRAVIDPDGWFHTGDLGHLDADGFLHVTGRLKSLIVLGTGKKVQPEELEARLVASPLIEEVCVLGIREPAGTSVHERVCAVVVPAGDENDDELVREVQDLCRSLAAYKRPATVVVSREPLPRTSTAKLKRALVRERLEETRRAAS